MITSYHNHTNWSDGRPTIAEQVEAARRIGLHEIGISDHYTLFPDGMEVDWTMPLDRLGDYVAEVSAAAAQSEAPVVRVGVEADFFPETVEALRAELARHTFDYVIGSVHYVDGFPLDEKRDFWDALTEDELNDKWRLYWIRISQMAQTGLYDFVGHLDLPKKFGHRPTADLNHEAHAALDAISSADMAIEINTAGWSLPAREGYPSPVLLRAARDRAIPLLINADAHFPEHLTRDFEKARALARDAGYTELVRYEKRRRYPVPL